MTRGTKEFQEMQEQFEKDIKNIEVYVGAHPVRGAKGATHFYENGKINDLFLGYMAGYANAKCMAQLGYFEKE